ncbi:MAG: amidohydrolase family protein [Gammaproteobacteria bacterium]
MSGTPHLKLRRLSCRYVLTSRGWLRDQSIGIDETGRITDLIPGQPPWDGFIVIPGMPNAHSHAFQRALTGVGERVADAQSFWSWRSLMYRLAASIGPEEMELLATLACFDMLRSGFTSVAEFFYLHHGPDGRSGVAMAQAVVRAADRTGIRLRLVPVYYERGGFEEALDPVQKKRFAHATVEAFEDYVRALDGVPLGVGAHSIRAVSPSSLERVGAFAESLGEGLFHIHVAEQEREVEQSHRAYGVGPIRLLDQLGLVTPHLQAVHGTHADPEERRLLVERGANLVLCPITEAYLADGIFPAVEYLAQGGSWAVGTDANVAIDAISELRLLEYGQRLSSGRRSNLADRSGIGTRLWQGAALGGARAVGFPVGVIESGAYADLVMLEDPCLLTGGDPDLDLDAFLIGGSCATIARVYVGGTLRSGSGRSTDEAVLRTEAGHLMARLRERMVSRIGSG